MTNRTVPIILHLVEMKNKPYDSKIMTKTVY
jgi:hypothetical protein